MRRTAVGTRGLVVSSGYSSRRVPIGALMGTALADGLEGEPGLLRDASFLMGFASRASLAYGRVGDARVARRDGVRSAPSL